MPQWTFRINDEYRTVDAFDLNEALKEANLSEFDDYEIIEGDDFEDRCLISAITDDILFGE